MARSDKHFSHLREKIYDIIFEADTPEGKIFDVALFAMIFASVIVVFLDSVVGIHDRYMHILISMEWLFTIFFSIEYILRLYCVYKPWKYATSFYGIIDLLAIIPTYLSIFIAGTQSLLVIRALRLLRVFRIFKLAGFMKEGSIILDALIRSRSKITIFLYFIILATAIIGSLMYLIEGGTNPEFDSIPRSMYWAIVTLTTVGYGDITPNSNIGQFLSAMVMILGYAVIAVPTGIVSAELVNHEKKLNRRACRHCSKEGHDGDAGYCKYCGEKLETNDIV